MQFSMKKDNLNRSEDLGNNRKSSEKPDTILILKETFLFRNVATFGPANL